jgi:hypothetical protein
MIYKSIHHYTNRRGTRLMTTPYDILLNPHTIDMSLRRGHRINITTLFKRACDQKADRYIISRIMFEDEFNIKLVKYNQEISAPFMFDVSRHKIHLKTLIRLFIQKKASDTMIPSLFELFTKFNHASLHKYVPDIRMKHIVSAITCFFRDHTQTHLPKLDTLQDIMHACMRIYTTHLPSYRIGHGSYGIVFRPAPFCENTTARLHHNAVGKIMPIKRGENEERIVKKIDISRLDVDFSYHVKLFDSCKPDMSILSTGDIARLRLSPTDDARMLIYEYGGMSLDALLESKRYSKRTIISSLSILFEGIVQMNSRGIYHMDIKPQNIVCRLYKGSLQCRLIDFGLAVSFENGSYPKPSRLYNTVYTWPYELMLYTTVCTSPKRRQMEYRTRFKENVDYVGLDTKYGDVSDWLINRYPEEPSKHILSLVRAMFEYNDIFQFGLLLSHPGLLGRNHVIVKDITCQYKTTRRPDPAHILSLLSNV